MMACPTCEHTMQGIGVVESGERVWWCPRCGTLKRGGNLNYLEHVDQPKLAPTVRLFLAGCDAGTRERARIGGVIEACSNEATRAVLDG